ncbi:response regulator transcription factor [Paenibacillus agaridevorans]|uniref:response regulator transcription factor n=1 Tax=Paenibacillus agaridevorans TaxID=171404 RepID=UPI001BE3F0CE|nr:response regulator transcription factor [Paenibacillus agaridevorans]
MNDRKSILIFEHDEAYRSQLKKQLEHEHFVVEAVENADNGLLYLLQNEIDVILLDMYLPGISGLDVRNMIRKFKSTPIIFLTTNEKGDIRLEGFQGGSDAYMDKSSAPHEIVSKIIDLQSRTTEKDYEVRTSSGNQLVFPYFIIDWDNYRISSDDLHIYLTRRERDLLQYLLNRPNVILTRDQLLKDIWANEATVNTRTVDTTIKRIRDKLNKAYPQAASMIKTVWGIGYIVKFNI